MTVLIALLMSPIGIQAAVQMGPDREPQFSKLFPSPTGANGIEEYVKAGDFLSATTEFSIYQAWIPPERRPSPQEVVEQRKANLIARNQLPPQERNSIHIDSQAEIQLEDSLNALNYYQVKKQEAGRFAGALEMMLDGNRKSHSFGFEMASQVGEMWLSSTRQLSKLAADTAYVEFASGHSAKGAEILEEVLIMGHQVGFGGVLPKLSSIGNSSIAISRFSDCLGTLSLDDAKSLVKLIGQILGDSDEFRSMLQAEKAKSELVVEQSIQGITDPNLVAQFRQLGPDRQTAWAKRMVEQRNAEIDENASFFQSPEQNWLASSIVSDVPSSAGSSDVGPPQNLEQLEASLKEDGSAAFSRSLVVAILRNRTQLRLLRLYARVIAFRWENGRLPTSIEEMKLPTTETEDLLSGRPFHYELKNGKYEVYSVGVADTGRIDLRYRRSISDSGRSTIDPS